MSLVEKSYQARNDLYDIWDHVADDGEEQADALLDLLNAKLMVLAEHPGLGTPRPELDRGLRSFVVGKYLLFYRSTSGGILAVRILHGSRNIAAQFGR